MGLMHLPFFDLCFSVTENVRETPWILVIIGHGNEQI